MNRFTRRQFLGDVGKGMIVASVGSSMASEMGLSTAALGADADSKPGKLEFGELEPLVGLMQDTPIERLMPTLVTKLKSGVELRTLLAAGALANARTFGGEDYVGFHTMMALAPAMHMAGELPADIRALPVLKVLYRNTNRIHEHGGRASEVLHAVEPVATPEGRPGGEVLRDLVRKGDVKGAEETFAALARISPDEALNDALMAMQDEAEVHRTVLPYRSWDMLGLIGKEHAHTLLRQSVRYCLAAGMRPRKDGPPEVLASMLDAHHLLEKQPGTRVPDDQWVDALAMSIFKATPPQAAELAAGALADGIAPDSVGQAICLAANQLILRDIGRTPNDETTNKPIGSVHGDSIGVHACDSANAWRNLARVSNVRNTYACLILGAYQVARDRVGRGGDFLNWKPLPVQRQVDAIKETDPAAIRQLAEEAIRGNLQAHACAAVERYGDLGLDPRPMFDLLLKYAISEDGSLHAEKFYRTASEEFASARPAFRWRQVIALARVTASEYGRPAAGYAEAKALLSA
ncbi:MAG TPA: hypothetical protein VFE47_18525 [Tepidisphaeraceae bacterium]|jgi:hypothetical protein|nr:hypothetical protein [Tepidisphaeraceae bacterium]